MLSRQKPHWKKTRTKATWIFQRSLKNYLSTEFGETRQGWPLLTVESWNWGKWGLLSLEVHMEDVIQCHSIRVAGPGPPCIRNTAYKWYFQSEGNASGGPGPVLQPAGGRALAHPASATLHTSAISEWGQCEWWALAHPASATLHTSAISEWGQCEWWALAHPSTGCRAGPGLPCIHNTADKRYFRVRAMRVVGQGPPCSLLEDPDWGADHFDMGLVCRGDLIPCHQVEGDTLSAVASRIVTCYFESTKPSRYSYFQKTMWW